jgi:DNA primase
VNSGLGVKVVTLPTGDDPDTYVRKEGPEAFTRLEQQAPSLLDFALEHSVKTAEGSTIEGRIRSVDEILKILQKSEHPIEREERIRLVAERFGINQQRLIDRYPELKDKSRSAPAALRAVPPPVPPSKAAPEERDLVYLLLHGQLSPSEVRKLRPDGFSVPACRRIVERALANLEQDGRVGLRRVLDSVVDDPECGSLATELSMREEHFDDPRAHIQGCLNTIDRKRAEADLRDLIGQLKAAEREGRVEDARALNEQVNELRSQKAGRPTGTLSLVKE